MKRCILPLFVALLAGTATPTLQAQVLYGSIVGNLSDPSDAPIPSATVTITNQNTNQSRQTTTGESGGYAFPTVPSGVYTITAVKSGFSTSTRRDVAVTINAVTRIDIALQLGAVSESVVVAAQAAVLQTDRAEVRHSVSSRGLNDLPIASGRNYQQIFNTIPGFTPVANSNSITANPSRALIANVNGASNTSNNIRIDGASHNSVWLPAISSYVPALESIETVDIVTNSFDAEQGLAGGAAINVQIKSGTNAMHGSAFEYYTGNALKAKPFFNPPGQRKPKTVFNQFGGTVGGPIIKDKLFYFASYEGSYNHQFTSGFGTVPTLAIRAGDMSTSPRAVYDPNSGAADGSGRTPFPGGIVPSSRFEPIALKLVALTPAPNIADALTNNFFATAPFAFDRNTLDSKFNWNATKKLIMFVRFSALKYSLENPQIFGPLGGPNTGGSIAGAAKGEGDIYSMTVAGTYIVSPNLIVDANFGWARKNTNALPGRLSENLGRDFLGIPGTNGTREFEGGWPQFSISTYTDIGNFTRAQPFYWRDPAFQYVANANWTHGNHNVRFGMDLSRQHLNHITGEFAGFGASGGFSFDGGVTTLRGGQSANQFNSYAGFLLGLASTAGRTLMAPDSITTRAWQHSYYVRDQWQMSRKLTVSYGLRWEYFPMPTRADRGLERYDLARNKMLVCGAGSTPRDCGVSISKTNFAPRLGIAYRATNTFVIRAGYGLTYDPLNLARPLRANYPVSGSLLLSGPNAFQPSSRLRDGVPAIVPPDLSSGLVDIPGTFVVTTPADSFARGYIQSWNLSLQKELAGGFTVQSSYVASRAIHKIGAIEANIGPVDGGNNGRALFKQFGRTANTGVLGALPGVGHYDSLQMLLQRRFAKGYQLQAAYTFSKATGISGTDTSGNNPRIQLPQYFQLNRSLTDFDRTHNLQMAGSAELPFGAGKRWLSQRGIGSAIAGGWQLSAIFGTYSGTPFSVTAAATSLNSPGNTQRADQVKPSVQILGGAGPGQSYFDPLAFAQVTDARFGTAGFNSVRGPGSVNLDLSVTRDFRITERWHVQFRAEAFNSSNTPHFANPGTNVSNLQLNPNGTVRSLGGYTEITSTTGVGREAIDERVFRMGLRISF